MTVQGQKDSGEARLVGWKRIAAHLGCSERTARRWESEESLPVHRQVHESKSTVYALPRELDLWVASRSQGAAPLPGAASLTPAALRWQPALLAAAALLLTIAVTLIFVIPLTGEAQDGNPDGLSADPIAADLYQRGRALWQQRGEVPNARAIKLLTEAVKRDEDFAPAWAALASAWATYPTYSDEITPQRARDEAMVAADRALRLDPGLAEPRTLMATFAQRKGDWAESERIYEEALAADPGNDTILLWYAGHYRELGMFDDAERLTGKAREIAPNAPPVLTEIAMNLLGTQRHAEGEALLDHLWTDLGVETPILWWGKFIALVRNRDFDGLEAWVDASPLPDYKPLYREFTEVLRNPSPTAADAIVQKIDAAYADGFPAWNAYYLLEQLDRPGRALDIAEAEAAKGLFGNSVILFDEHKPAARRTARFAGLVERLGFVKYWRRTGPPRFCREEAETPVCRRIAAAAKN